MYAENEILFIEDKIRADERERIIKILEADLDRAGLSLHDKAHSIAEVIALIKAEPSELT